MHRHLGNFVSLHDALARHEPDVIRLFYLSAHYRTPLRWTDEAVQASARGLERLRTALANSEEALSGASDRGDAGLSGAVHRAREAFGQTMDDDLNTPQAVTTLFALAAEMNKATDAAMKGVPARAGLWDAADTLRELAQVLGLSLKRPGLTPELVSGLRAVLAEVRQAAVDLFPDAADPQDPDDLIRALLAGREQARQRRAYAIADRVRSRLGDLGIVVEDLPAGPRWRVVSADQRRPVSDARQS